MPKTTEVDEQLQISKAYLESIESGRRIQSRGVDNYLRLFFAKEIQFFDRITQRQSPQCVRVVL